MKKIIGYWLFAKDQINYVEPGSLSDKPIIESIPLPYKLIKSVAGYENILPLGENNYLVGTTSGYLTIDLKKQNSDKYVASINNITNTKKKK